MNFSFYRYAVLGLCLIALSCPAWAEEARQYTDKEYWDAIAKRPDATITITKDPTTGAEIKTATFKGGVTITSVDGGLLSQDTSGLGAVLCTREIIESIIYYAKKCPSSEIGIGDVNHITQKMDQFIVDNSILPITLSDIEVARKEKEKQNDEWIEERGTPICNSQNDAETKKLWSFFNHGEKGDSFEKMLSVPRPAVMNPCF